MFRAQNSIQKAWENSVVSCMAKLASSDMQLHGLNPERAEQAELTQSKLRTSFYNNLPNIINYALWSSNNKSKSTEIIRELGYPVPAMHQAKPLNYDKLIQKFIIVPEEPLLASPTVHTPEIEALENVLSAWHHNKLTATETTVLVDLMFPDIPRIYKEYISMGILTWFCSVKAQGNHLSGSYMELLEFLHIRVLESIIHFNKSMAGTKKTKSFKWEDITGIFEIGYQTGTFIANQMVQAYADHKYIFGLPFSVTNESRLVVAYIYLCGTVAWDDLLKRFGTTSATLKKYLKKEADTIQIDIHKDTIGKVMCTHLRELEKLIKPLQIYK